MTRNGLRRAVAKLDPQGSWLGYSSINKEDTNMSKQRRFITGLGLIGAFFGAMSCAPPPVVTPLPQNVRRIAVLPPYQLGVDEGRTARSQSDVPDLPSRTISDLLAEQARSQLAAKGFDVVEPSIVKLATKDRVPTSPQMAAQILRDANLDAAALYIEVRRWLPTPYERGMKADGVIVALDVTMVDPKTGAILWEVHRPSRPVPLYGNVLTGQANTFVAESVMQEVFAQRGSRKPNA